MTYDEITLGQWLQMEEAAKDYDNDYYQAAAKISVLSGHDVDDLISMPLNKYGKIQSKYDFLMYPPRTIMTTTFEGKPFNLDFKTLPYGDFVDLMEIIKTTPERIDLIIAKLWQSGMTLEASAKVIRDKMNVPLAMGLSAFFFDYWERLQPLILQSLNKKIRKMEREMKIHSSNPMGGFFGLIKLRITNRLSGMKWKQ
jgi:hypothetical protein